MCSVAISAIREVGSHNAELVEFGHTTIIVNGYARHNALILSEAKLSTF